MFMNRKIKSVSFNLNDKFEKDMYEYSQQYPNFSSFIKRLIQNSLYGGTQQAIQCQSPQTTPTHKTIINQPQSEPLSMSQDMLRQFL